MTTSGLNAFGTTFKWNGTALAELTSIGGPKLKVDTIDLTSHDSTSGFREFVAGLKDGGEIKIEGNFIAGDTSGQIAFITDLKAGTKREVIITGPAAGAFTWTFDAIGTDYEPTFPDDGKLGFSASLKVTGVPVLGITFAGDLTGLVINTGTLSPALTAATYVYAATTTGTSVTVTPTYSSATAIEVWSGATFSALTLVSTLSSGGTSSAIAIADVLQHVCIRVRVKRTGYATRDYDVTLIKTS